MSRRVDIDFILAETDEFAYENGALHGLSGNSAPSIDIVRCKECKHGQDDLFHMFCAYHHHKTYADDFCSYGEREGE